MSKRFFYILKRELSGYFNSTIAYIYITLFLVMVNFFFFKDFFITGTLSMRNMFDLTPWIMFLFIPTVTMRLWSEEKRRGTDEVLFTLPVTEWDIVLGKYLGGLTFVVITILLTINIPITLLFLGKVDPGPIIGGYAGLVFIASAFISIGFFVSTFTSNQIIAYLLAAVAGFLFFIIGHPMLTSGTAGFFSEAMSYLGLYAHFTSIGRGVFDLRDFIYYTSFTAVFLLGTHFVVKKRY
ncbi:ABC-2 transporter permease [bacterium]|nr:ABC-2 transporter permease [bacterium]